MKYSLILVIALLLNVNGKTPGKDLSEAAKVCTKTKSISSMTNTEIENSVHALVSMELALHALEDEELCLLQTILQDPEMSETDKYDAMAQDDELYAFRNTCDYYVGIMAANNMDQMPSPVPTLAEDTYLNDWGIATVAVQDCTQWLNERKKIGREQVFCAGLCLVAKATSAAVACQLGCLIYAANANYTNNANYPECAQGYSINPHVATNSTTSPCQ